MTLGMRTHRFNLFPGEAGAERLSNFENSRAVYFVKMRQKERHPSLCFELQFL
jgi:hypothetical protein